MSWTAWGSVNTVTSLLEIQKKRRRRRRRRLFVKIPPVKFPPIKFPPIPVPKPTNKPTPKMGRFLFFTSQKLTKYVESPKSVHFCGLMKCEV